MLLTRGIHGLVVGPMPTAHSRLELDFAGIAAVAIAHSLESPVLHRVGHNHYQATWDGLDYLYAQGRRRFGLAVQESLMDRVGQRWHAAYHEFCRTHEGTTSLPSILLDAQTLDQRAGLRHAAGVQAWVREHRLDAVLGLSPWLVTLIRKGGWQVPEEVVYFDLDTYPGKFREAAPGIDQNAEGIGAAAVDELVAQWGRRDYGVPAAPKTILLDGQIVE